MFCVPVCKVVPCPSASQSLLRSDSAAVHQNKLGWLQKVTILGHVMLPIASRLILSYSHSRLAGLTRFPPKIPLREFWRKQESQPVSLSGVETSSSSTSRFIFYLIYLNEWRSILFIFCLGPSWPNFNIFPW